MTSPVNSFIGKTFLSQKCPGMGFIEAGLSNIIDS
jgi:hypothetical protein